MDHMHYLIKYRCFHAQYFVQFGGRGGVLHMDFLVRENIRRSTKRSQCRFMEAGQDQFLLSGIGIDITHCKNARNIGFKLLGIHDFQLFAFDIEAPVSDSISRLQSAIGPSLGDRP